MLRMTGGRPGLRRLLVSYFLAASLRCQVSSVVGVMGPTQSSFRAAQVLRSASSGVDYTTHGPLQTVATRAVSRADACENGQVRCFSLVFYALDTGAAAHIP